MPLHQLWLGYMSELLGLGVAPPPPPLPAEERQGSSSVDRAPAVPQPAGTMHAKLIKADFHGSIMTGQSVISRSRGEVRSVAAVILTFFLFSFFSLYVCALRRRRCSK